jgi:hypothetical protein
MCRFKRQALPRSCVDARTMGHQVHIILAPLPPRSRSEVSIWTPTLAGHQDHQVPDINRHNPIWPDGVGILAPRTPTDQGTSMTP